MCDVMPTILEDSGSERESLGSAENLQDQGGSEGNIALAAGACAPDYAAGSSTPDYTADAGTPDYAADACAKGHLDAPDSGGASGGGLRGEHRGETRDRGEIRGEDGTGDDEEGEQSIGTDAGMSSNLEQLMVSMLDERDRLMETLRDTQEKMQFLQQKFTELEKDRDLLQKQMECTTPQVLSHSTILHFSFLFLIFFSFSRYFLFSFLFSHPLFPPYLTFYFLSSFVDFLVFHS